MTWTEIAGVSARATGYLDGDGDLAAAYSAADVFVLPTLAENLPNGALESLACGTPVIAFDVGGVGEVVRHMETGYLAAARDDADLAAGVRRLLEDETLRARLGRHAREVAVAEYGLDLQRRRFTDLYHAVLGTATVAV